MLSPSVLPLGGQTRSRRCVPRPTFPLFARNVQSAVRDSPVPDIEGEAGNGAAAPIRMTVGPEPAPLVTAMTDDQRSDEAREMFAYFSNEYAQALQAFKTIEAQSSTLLLMGVSDELRGFIEQFITMASGTKALAEERGEMHFAEWFGELIRKAEALRSEIVPQ